MKTLAMTILFAVTAFNLMSTSAQTVEIAATRSGGHVMLAEAR